MSCPSLAAERARRRKRGACLLSFAACQKGYPLSPLSLSVGRGTNYSVDKKRRNDFPRKKKQCGWPSDPGKRGPGDYSELYLGFPCSHCIEEKQQQRNAMLYFPFFLLLTQYEWRQTLFPVHSNSIASNKSKLPSRGAFKRKEEEGEGSCKCVTSQQIVVKEPHYTLDDTEDPSKHFGHDFLSFPVELLCPEKRKKEK